MIVTDINKLKIPCSPVENIEEGEKIAIKLLKELAKAENGIGLSAIQIGINKRVCVINVMKEPLILINPQIIKLDDVFFTEESCLSFPKKTVKTRRHKYVTIECDNIGKVLFGPSEITGTEENNRLQLLESICIQHEISHLDGLTMFDFQYTLPPIKSTKKFSRNEKIMITNGKESKTLKWKKAEPLVDSGEWEVYTHTQ